MSAQPTTRHGIPADFLDAADRFVQLANALNEQYPRDWVRAAMMYATARYNAFVWLTREEAPEQTLEQAANYFTAEYDRMLRDNVDEIAPHYQAAEGGDSNQR